MREAARRLEHRPVPVLICLPYMSASYVCLICLPVSRRLEHRPVPVGACVCSVPRRACLLARTHARTHNTHARTHARTHAQDAHRHYSHPTTDIRIQDLPKSMAWFLDNLPTKLFPAISACFPNLAKDPEGPRIFDVFVVKYNSEAQSYLKVIYISIHI